MGKLTAYTQNQLASSVVGVPGVDRSNQIIAETLRVQANEFANFQIGNLQRRTTAEDSLAINTISDSRDSANLQMQQFMQTNPDPATWENGWNTIVQGQQKQFIGKTLTRDAAALEKLKQKAFELDGRRKVQIAATEQTVTNSIEANGTSLIKTMGDPFSSESQKENQKAAYMDSLLQRHTKEIADVMMEEVLLQGEEQVIENANKIARNFAAINPKEATNITQQELQARAQGKNLFPEFSVLSNSDLEALKDYAGTVGNENDGKSKKIADAKIIEIYGKVRDAAPGQPFDLDAVSDSVELDPDMNNTDKKKVMDDTRSYYSTYNSAISEKVLTTDEARIVMNKLRQKIKRGDTVEGGGFFTADKAFAEYKKLKSKQKINTVDNKAFLENIFKDEESARDVRVSKIATVIDRKEKQLRDAIEKQPSFLGAGPIDEVLKDFANEAVIEFTDKFIDDTPETFNRDSVDAEATRLTQKFTLSQTQQTLAVGARNIAQAESLKEQQAEIKKQVTLLQSEGKTEEAKQIMEEAQRLGIPIDGKEAEGKAKNTSILINILKLAIESL